MGTYFVCEMCLNPIKNGQFQRIMSSPRLGIPVQHYCEDCFTKVDSKYLTTKYKLKK